MNAEAAEPACRAWRRWFGAMALLALTFAAYAPALRAGFVWDDVVVADNHLLESLRGLWQIFFEPRAQTYEAHYWPLPYATFWVEHRLFGGNPLGYHAVNIALHALSSILLWRIFVGLRIGGAWLCGAVFAVHPVHVESVAWVVERKDVLACLFFLLAFHAYASFCRSRRALPYAVALVAFVLAMLSKAIAIVFPLALLLCVFLHRGRFPRRDLIPIAGFAALAALIAFLDFRYARTRDPVELELSLLERCAVAGRAFWFYLWKLIAPLGLMPVYPRWTFEENRLAVLLYPAAVVAMLIALWLLRKRLGRGPLVAMLFFGFSLGPMLGFLDFYFMTYSFVADRFQYLASIGPIALGCAAASAWVKKLRWPQALRAVASGAILCVLATLCFAQSRRWKDDETLFGYNVAANPAAWQAWINLGNAYVKREAFEEGRQALSRAVELCPESSQAHYNLASALSGLGLLEEARAELLEALRLDPNYSQAYNNLGFVYDQLGQPDEAAKAYAQAVKTNPFSYEAVYNWGNVLGKLGKYEEAMGVFLEAERLRPSNNDPVFMQAVCLEALGRRKEAIVLYERTLVRDPTYFWSADNLHLAHYNEGEQLFKEGNYRAAYDEFLRALEYRPDGVDALHYKAECLEQFGELEEAEAIYEEILEEVPDYHWSRDNLERVRARQREEGKQDAASGQAGS